jgi:hypothetical protein
VTGWRWERIDGVECRGVRAAWGVFNADKTVHLGPEVLLLRDGTYQARVSADEITNHRSLDEAMSEVEVRLAIHGRGRS